MLDAWVIDAWLVGVWVIDAHIIDAQVTTAKVEKHMQHGNTPKMTDGCGNGSNRLLLVPIFHLWVTDALVSDIAGLIDTLLDRCPGNILCLGYECPGDKYLDMFVWVGRYSVVVCPGQLLALGFIMNWPFRR